MRVRIDGYTNTLTDAYQFLQRVRLALITDRCNSKSGSVSPSVRPSHSDVLSRRMNITIVRFSASGRTIILVSAEVKLILISAGDNPQRGR